MGVKNTRRQTAGKPVSTDNAVDHDSDHTMRIARQFPRLISFEHLVNIECEPMPAETGATPYIDRMEGEC